MELYTEESGHSLANGDGRITKISSRAGLCPIEVDTVSSHSNKHLRDLPSVAETSNGVVSHRINRLSPRPHASAATASRNLATSSRTSSRYRAQPHTRLRRGSFSTKHWDMPDDDDDDDADAGPSARASFRTGIYLLDAARKYSQLFVRHSWFDAFIGLVIVVNSVCIGLEQEFKLTNVEAPVLQALEHVFVAVYLFELFLRFVGGGFGILHDNWIRFDVFIVLVSVCTQWILDAEQLGEMRVVVLMRLARLARLARTVNLIINFRELWILVNGLLASAGILFYTMLLIGLMIYAFALLGVELIAIRHATEGSSDPVVDSIVAENFSSLWITMLTLTRFVTLDSIGDIYTPLVQYDPWLAIYFIILILCSGIVMMNLITGVIVNEALEQAQHNKEAAKVHEAKQKKKYIRHLQRLFAKLDDDESGMVDIEEIMASTDEDVACLQGFIKENDLREIFLFLDVNGDGELDIEEFCEGLYQAMVSQTPLEFKRIDKRVAGVQCHVEELRAMQCELLAKFNDLARRLDARSHDLHRPCSMLEVQVSDRPLSPAVADVPMPRGDALLEVQRIMTELNHQVVMAFGQRPSPSPRRDRHAKTAPEAITPISPISPITCGRVPSRDETAVSKPLPASNDCAEDWHSGIPVEREVVRSNPVKWQSNQAIYGNKLRPEAKRHTVSVESPRTPSRGPSSRTI